MATNPDDGTGDGEEKWRFSLEDIEKRNAEDTGDGDGDSGDGRDGDGEDEDGGGNVAGSLTPAGEITAGDIDWENALFVLVGAVLAVLVLVGFMTILP